GAHGGAPFDAHRGGRRGDLSAAGGDRLRNAAVRRHADGAAAGRGRPAVAGAGGGPPSGGGGGRGPPGGAPRRGGGGGGVGPAGAGRRAADGGSRRGVWCVPSPAGCRGGGGRGGGGGVKPTAALIAHEWRYQRRTLRFRAFAGAYLVLACLPAILIYVRR